MKLFLKFVLVWGPVIAWAGLIYYFSSIPNLRAVSDPKWDELVRSFSHFLMFLVLCLLFFRSVNHQKPTKQYLLPWVLTCLYSVFDEIHQSFVPTRTFQIQDLLIDFSGAGLAVFLIFYAILIAPKKIRLILAKIGYA